MVTFLSKQFFAYLKCSACSCKNFRMQFPHRPHRHSVFQGHKLHQDFAAQIMFGSVNSLLVFLGYFFMTED